MPLKTKKANQTKQWARHYTGPCFGVRPAALICCRLLPLAFYPGCLAFMSNGVLFIIRTGELHYWYLCIALNPVVFLSNLGLSAHIAPNEPMSSIDQRSSSLNASPTFLSPNPYNNPIFGSFNLCQVLSVGRQTQMLSLLQGLVVCLTIPCLSYCISLVIKPFLYYTNVLTLPFHSGTTLSDFLPFKDTTFYVGWLVGRLVVF